MAINAKSFLVPINLNKNEIRQAVIENAATAPSSPVKGQIYYDSTNNITYVYSGTAWEKHTVSGAIVNADISATAAIANSKLANSSVTIGSTAVALGSTATTIAGLTSVTSTTFVGALSGNASTATALNTARTINGVSFDGSANITVAANTTNALTISTGLSGTSFNGSSAVTIAIDSTVATLTGTQTFTNKTLTTPTINGATLTGTVTVPSPVNATDAANKQYVDNVAQGINAHDAVQYATTTTLAAVYAAGTTGGDGGTGVGATITFSATGVQAIDSSTNLALNDRVLVKNGVTAAAGTSSIVNGIYYVTTAPAVGVAGILTRALDADNSIAGDITSGDLVYILASTGSTQGGTSWVQTATGTATTPNKGIKIGTDVITWTQFAGASTATAGAGLVANGNAFDVASTTLTISADAVNLSTVTYSNTTPTATTSFISGLTTDTYGRVTGVATTTHSLATTAAAGIASFNSNAFSVSSGAVSLTTGARTVIGAAGKYTATNPAITIVSGQATWTVPQTTHLLATSGGYIIQVKDTTTFSNVEVDVQINESTGDVTLGWNSASNVTAGAYRVTIIG